MTRLHRPREADITVLGGLPITVKYTVQPAEPDVGITDEYVDDWWPVAVGGRPAHQVDWLLRRIAQTKGEEDRIAEQLADALADARDYDDGR